MVCVWDGCLSCGHVYILRKGDEMSLVTVWVVVCDHPNCAAVAITRETNGDCARVVAEDAGWQCSVRSGLAVSQDYCQKHQRELNHASEHVGAEIRKEEAGN